MDRVTTMYPHSHFVCKDVIIEHIHVSFPCVSNGIMNIQTNNDDYQQYTDNWRNRRYEYWSTWFFSLGTTS